MIGLVRWRGGWGVVALAVLSVLASVRAQDGQPLNPFGAAGGQERDDSLPGYLEQSDGSVHPGRIYLTRDARLKLYDDKMKQQREIPLRVVKRIDCTILKEWDEKEWRFKENANDEKYFTGHTYPAREYVHKITLNDGRTISGPLQLIIYVQGEDEGEGVRFLIHKRDKGELDVKLKDLLYVKAVVLGEKALEEGKKKAEAAAKKAARPVTESKSKRH